MCVESDRRHARGSDRSDRPACTGGRGGRRRRGWRGRLGRPAGRDGHSALRHPRILPYLPSLTRSLAPTPLCTAWTAPRRRPARPAPSSTSTLAPTDPTVPMVPTVSTVPTDPTACCYSGTPPCGAREGRGPRRRSAGRRCGPTSASSSTPSPSNARASPPPSPSPPDRLSPSSPSPNLQFPRLGRFRDSGTAKPFCSSSEKRAAFLARCRDDPSSCLAQSLRRRGGDLQAAAIHEAPTVCQSKTPRGRRPLFRRIERFSLFILVSWTVIACQLWNLRWQWESTLQVRICEVECEARLYQIEISLSAGSSASSTPSQQNTLRLLKCVVRTSYYLVCWMTRG